MAARPHRPRANVGRSPIYDRWGLPLPEGGAPPQLPQSTAAEDASRGAAAATTPALSPIADVGLDRPGALGPMDERGFRDWRRVALIAAGALLGLGVVLAAALGIAGGNDIGPDQRRDTAGRGSATGEERSVIAVPPSTTDRIEVEAVAEVNEPTAVAATQSSSGQKPTPGRDPVASPVTDPAPSPPDAPPPSPTTTPAPTTTTTPPTTTTAPPTTTTLPELPTTTTLPELLTTTPPEPPPSI